MAGPREGKSLLQKSRTLSGHSYPCAIEVQGPHSEAAQIGQALEVRRAAFGGLSHPKEQPQPLSCSVPHSMT